MKEHLINKVREHVVLYDVNSKHYRDHNIRNEVWEDISDDLNIPASECKETWAKLRNCFANALKRRRSKKCRRATKKIAPWKYEDQMSFLLPFMEVRSTHITLKPTTDAVAENTSSDVRKEDTGVAKVENWKSVPDSHPDVFPGQLTSATKQRKTDDYDYGREKVEILKESTGARRERHVKKQAIKVEQDEVDMFYQSMATTIKRLPKIDQARLRMEFCRMVSEAEIKNMETTNSSRPSSSASSYPPVSPASDSPIA